MSRSDFSFSFEIAGPMAMFMRPDSGSTPVSFPIPTGSAIKAMVESIAWVEGAIFHPTCIEICRPTQYVAYSCNYGGPLRKGDQIKKGASFQHVARVLADVCFKVHGECIEYGECDTPHPRKKLIEMLTRRLEEGQSRYPAYLGWKEFAPSYFGHLRDETERDETVSAPVEGYLVQVWSKAHHGVWDPRFANVKIVEGVCNLKEAWQNAT